eukprot:gb/GECH01008415.1/.p1 GENE.gb/GECH01008415.1/~~gb/GECH01008415.1/.p1  ORF type:complete len:129 (+),score=21.70 gb/GECH01008415.1/:1-387(+)
MASYNPADKHRLSRNFSALPYSARRKNTSQFKPPFVSSSDEYYDESSNLLRDDFEVMEIKKAKKMFYLGFLCCPFWIIGWSQFRDSLTEEGLYYSKRSRNAFILVGILTSLLILIVITGVVLYYENIL